MVYKYFLVWVRCFFAIHKSIFVIVNKMLSRNYILRVGIWVNVQYTSSDIAIVLQF